MDQVAVLQHIRTFIKTLEAQLMHYSEIPCAFAIMTIDTDWNRIAQFNILSGGSPQLLPRGKAECEEFLIKALREWEEANYPERICMSPTKH